MSAYEYQLTLFHHIFNRELVLPPSHTGDTLLLLYLKHGKITFHSETTGTNSNVPSQHFTATSGNLILLNKHIIDQFIPSEAKQTLEYYYLQLTFFRHEVFSAPLSGISAHQFDFDSFDNEYLYPIVDNSMCYTLPSVFDILEKEFIARNAGWETMCGYLTQTILRLFSSKAASHKEQSSRSLTEESLPQQILEYLNIHYTEKITVQTVADAFFIHPSYLSHLMKDHFQISLMKYITNLRISQAKSLLTNTDYTINQIAQMVGYQNTNYFFNVFKKATSFSPKEYRENSHTK